METTLFHSNTPAVYRVRLGCSSFDELLTTYEELLKGACTSTVKSKLIDYVTESVEPSDWMAVWRPLQKSEFVLDFDYVVEVKNVNWYNLEADAKLLDIINYCEMSNNIKENHFENMMNQEKCVISLTELYPISEGDEEEKFLKTAVAIEHIRFFYKYIWRPWDDDDDDIVFADKHLVTRLKFYFDIKKKIVTEAIADRANEILNEGWQTKHKLEALEQTLNASDSESELNEDDVAEILYLRIKLEELQRQMEMLENPLIRNLVTKKDISLKSPVAEKRRYSGPVHHIVAERFTLNLINNLSIDFTATLEFHHTLSSAIAKACSGDHILILPGYYKCESLGWLDENITIEGIGNTGSVILEGIDNGTVFINCAAPDIAFHHLVLKSRDEVMSCIIVHSGHLKLIDCLIEGIRAKNCITVLSDGKATIKGSKLWNAKQHGIQISSSASLIMHGCTISDCGKSGLKIDGDEATESSSTFVSLHDSTIKQNGGYGIIVTNMIANAPTLVDENSDENNILQSICWLKTKIEKMDIHDNEHGNIGLHSCMQPLLDFELDGNTSHSSEEVISKSQWLESSHESVFD